MEILILNMNDFSDELYSSAIGMLSQQKRERAERMKNLNRRRFSAAGDMLARRLVSRLFAVKPEDIQVTEDENGKPHIGGLPIYISISHSGSFALCAASGVPIGADIERTGRFRPGAAARVCTESELAYISEDPERRFTELWTLKEAYSKATGRGILSRDGKREIPVINGKLMLADRDTRFRLFGVLPGYTIAVCELIKFFGIFD